MRLLMQVPDAALEAYERGVAEIESMGFRVRPAPLHAQPVHEQASGQRQPEPGRALQFLVDGLDEMAAVRQRARRRIGCSRLAPACVLLQRQTSAVCNVVGASTAGRPYPLNRRENLETPRCANHS